MINIERCTAKDCIAPAKARQLCARHYQRLRLHGNPEAVLKRGPKPKSFHEKNQLDYRTGCNLWTGAQTSAGYGCLSISGRVVTAHRVAYMLHHGLSQLPTGLHVLHRCDRPLCVNPDHLWLGTHAENMADMRSKGRARNGSTGKLTYGRPDDVSPPSSSVESTVAPSAS